MQTLILLTFSQTMFSISNTDSLSQSCIHTPVCKQKICNAVNCEILVSDCNGIFPVWEESSLIVLKFSIYSVGGIGGKLPFKQNDVECNLF